jgi:hypothetical protein
MTREQIFALDRRQARARQRAVRRGVRLERRDRLRRWAGTWRRAAASACVPRCSCSASGAAGYDGDQDVLFAARARADPHARRSSTTTSSTRPRCGAAASPSTTAGATTSPC